MPAVRAAGVTIRPLLPEDAAGGAAAAHVALAARCPEPERTPEEEAIRVAGATARVAHLQRTDPGGCWVAEHDGRVVGCALGLIREGVWGLSLFALLPDYQGLGIGTRLYAPALDYGAGEPGGIIMSSLHPAAIRRYARSPGYRLLPAISLSGAWTPSRAPGALRSRPGDLARDAQTLAAASRFVRGASHLRDLPTLLARPGVELLVIDGEGFACAHKGSPWLLAARSEEAAEDLLWGALASGPRGATVELDCITADNQWALRVGLQAGLAASGCGPLLVRGEVGPMAPYLPSGMFL